MDHKSHVRQLARKQAKPSQSMGSGVSAFNDALRTDDIVEYIIFPSTPDLFIRPQ